MNDVINALKYAMGNNGNPLVLTHDYGEKRAIAEALMKEFSAKSAILFSREEIAEALDKDVDLDVVIFDGDSEHKDYLEKVFARFSSARRVCFARSEFWNEDNLYDTILVG